MFFDILKRDLRRKKTMNIIVLIFVILAVTFIASSANNLVAVTSSLDSYFEKAGVGDYVIFERSGGKISVKEAVKDLDAPADERVIYNIHCYEPLAFTHQGAPWVPWLDQNVEVSFEEAGVDPDFFERAFASAIGTAEKHGTALYCGEYGVIDRATPEDTVKWYRVIHDTFEKHEISRSAWSYRRMDFGLSDERMDGVRDRLIPLL